MINTKAKWEPPCFLWGVAVVTAFSGDSFGLLQKSHSPSKAKPPCATMTKHECIKKTRPRCEYRKAKPSV